MFGRGLGSTQDYVDFCLVLMRVFTLGLDCKDFPFIPHCFAIANVGGLSIFIFCSWVLPYSGFKLSV